MTLGDAATYASAVVSVELHSLAVGFGERWRAPDRDSESGQGMVEYAIIAAVIAIAVLAAVQAFGQGISTVFGNLLGQIQGLGR
jgi:Flp pilus assembly pilin Flp